MAVRSNSTFVPISSLIRDPFVRAAFQRAERGPGFSFAVPVRPRPVLVGGEAVKVEMVDG